MPYSPHAGIRVTNRNLATIENGATTSASVPDLERPFVFVSIGISDCSNIPASTALRLQLGFNPDDTLKDFYRYDTESQDIITLPTSGTFWITVPVFGARRVRPVLSNSASGGTVIVEIAGVEQAVQDTI